MSKKNGKSTKNGTSPKRGGRGYPFETFAKVWAQSKNVADVMAGTGLARGTIVAIASKLRKAGVKLKMFPKRVAQPIDTAALNKVVAANTASA